MKIKKSSGKVSSIFLVLAIVLVVFIVIIFFVIKIAATKNANPTPVATENTEPEIPKPVYDVTVGEMRFVVQKAENMGSLLVSPDIRFQQNLTTTEKYIKLTIGAQNVGKVNTQQGSWNLGNIIDSEGRNFVPIDNETYYFLPKPNLCSTVLKPLFKPTPCVKYYEVSKESKGLKVQVLSSDESAKKQTALLDLPLN